MMLKLAAESFYIPKDNPLKPYGEDAHFFNKAAQVIGVADGVGSWAKKGIDAGEYARELMTHAENAVYYCSPGQVDPMQVLIEASHRTMAPGSSTACIIALAGEKLVASNMGDSGFIVIRNGKTSYESGEMQHSFNHPYQLGNSDSSDAPEEADEFKVKVKIGDVVIAGTDGLFDNLHLEEIADIVDGCLDWSRLPEDLARAAHQRSTGFGKAPRGPYAMVARAQLSRLKKKTSKGKYRHDLIYDQYRNQHGYSICTGGKEDDITVVVARVVPKY